MEVGRSQCLYENVRLNVINFLINFTKFDFLKLIYQYARDIQCELLCMMHVCANPSYEWN